MAEDELRKLARRAGIDDERMDAFEVAMAGVKAVLDGRSDKPGGRACTFPHCACNAPWTRCEKDPVAM